MTAAVAQAPAEASAAERCRALLERLPFLRPSGPAAAAEPVGSDGCRFEGVRFGMGGPAGWQVASLLVRGIVFDPPAILRQKMAVRVEARGVAFSLQSDMAAMNWVNRQQQVPFDLVLDFTADPPERRAAVRELSMEGEAVGRVALEAAFEGVDALDAATMLPRRVEAVGVRSAALRLDSRRFIVSYVLPGMTSVLPDDDPGGAVERAKAAVAATAQELLAGGGGGTGASAGTVDAVVGFVRDFPRPKHPFALTVQASAGPVRADDLARAAGSKEALTELVRGLRIEATYEGVFR